MGGGVLKGVKGASGGLRAKALSDPVTVGVAPVLRRGWVGAFGESLRRFYLAQYS